MQSATSQHLTYGVLIVHLFVHLSRFRRLLKVADNALRGGSERPTPPIFLASKMPVKVTPHSIKSFFASALSTAKSLEVNMLNRKVFPVIRRFARTETNTASDFQRKETQAVLCLHSAQRNANQLMCTIYTWARELDDSVTWALQRYWLIK